MNPETRPPGSGGRVDEKVLRWAELPWLLKTILERTPRAQWHKIRPILATSPETHKVLDVAQVVEQVFPRSTLGMRRRDLSIEERTHKAQELIQSFDEFWAGVRALEKVLEKIARSCGIWATTEARKYPARPAAAARAPVVSRPPVKPKAQAAPPPPPQAEYEALPEAVFEVERHEGDGETEGAA